MELIATPANMRAVEQRGGRDASRRVFAYSRRTGERYSATPGDYFAQGDDEPLTDAGDGPMVLAYERSEIVVLTDDELTGAHRPIADTLARLQVLADQMGDQLAPTGITRGYLDDIQECIANLRREMRDD